MHYCLYQIFKDFQSLIVGFIGFSGVVLTLYINARIGRKNIQNGVEHERNTLKNAISAELNFILTYFNSLVEDTDSKNEKNSAYYPEEISQLVYKNFISKLGLLSAQQATEVINAYALINEIPIRLKFLSIGQDPSLDRKGWIYISEDHEKESLRNYSICIPSIERALFSLQK